MKLSRKKAPKMVESTLKASREGYDDTAESAYAEGGKAGYSKEAEHAISNKMHKMAGEDRPHDQKVAIAISEAREKGLKVPHAKGGPVHSEEEIEHAASLAAAIMARRRMARGGEILSEDSMETSEDEQSDLSRNAEEDANMEDKASFDALRKENYSEEDALTDLTQPDDSNEHGDDIDSDEHDMVSSIRKRIKRSPINR